MIELHIVLLLLEAAHFYITYPTNSAVFHVTLFSAAARAGYLELVHLYEKKRIDRISIIYDVLEFQGCKD